MISLSNQRTFHGLTAAIVANKSGLRNHVLNKFQVPASMAEVLRGTDFASEGVFGELPKWFLEKFSSANRNNLTCRPKPTAKSSSSDPSLQTKRNSSAASQQPYNKQNTNNYSD